VHQDRARLTHLDLAQHHPWVAMIQAQSSKAPLKMLLGKPAAEHQQPAWQGAVGCSLM
jgi:hypothetical protein